MGVGTGAEDVIRKPDAPSDRVALKKTINSYTEREGERSPK